MFFDWRKFQTDNLNERAVVDPRRRLRIFLGIFTVGLFVVIGRIVQLEVSEGAAFRADALRPVKKKTVLPATRGRILARDGTVLATDQKIQALALSYRRLQDPPDQRWLYVTARQRLSKADRRNAEKLAATKADVLAERDATAERLAKLCKLSPQQWADQTRRIQNRVERIAANANRRRESQTTEADDKEETWAVQLRRLLFEDPAPPRIVVAEELTHHVVVDEVSPAAASEVSAHPDKYPGAKIVEITRRIYPKGTLAAHVLGHLGPVMAEELKNPSQNDDYLPDDWIGRIGVERQHENALRGNRGEAVENTDRSGHVLSAYHVQEPRPGHDVTLTLDPALQRTAEELLAGAIERRAITGGTAESAGGAIAVMDIHSGSLLAAASAPTFDPNMFPRGKTAAITALLADKRHPMFDRVSRMAIPPGSTFKTLSAVALLESGAISPQEPFHCQGFLHQPDRQRCEIYVRQGIGHDDVTLADALCVSCNVYFFHFAGQMGPRSLVDWANRFGFGRPTGIDLPGEAAGVVPSPENIARLEGHAWRTSDTQSMAVGQGSLTATPLQILRMMAAIGNGGRLVTPHVTEEVRDRGTETRESGRQQTLSLSSRTLETIREGLRRVVADEKGTGRGTVYLESVAIAGKTGTAETGEDQASHAWFAGYVPTDEPRLAFVVALEHAGDAATAAGPVAKRLVLRMEQLGMLK